MATYYDEGLGTLTPTTDETGDELAAAANYTIPSGAWYGHGTWQNKFLSEENIVKIRYEEFPP